MNVLTLVGIGFATCLMVSARSFQQLNVMHHRIKWVWPTSFVMASMEVLLVSSIISIGPIVILSMGIGGAAGCVAAMQLHKLLRTSND